MAPFIDQNIGEDQEKKRSSLQNKLVFSVRKYMMTKKKKKSLPTKQWVFGLQKKMVTPEAGRPTPPPLATPLFTLLSFTKNFSFPAIGVARIFDWKGGGGGNHKSLAMTSSEICEKGTFCNTKISQNGKSKVVVRVWHVNRILLKGEEDLS